MKFTALPSEAYYERYDKAFSKLEFDSEEAREAFRKRVFSLQGAVDERLKQKWDSDDDFEVGWDFDYCAHICGGVYSEQILTPDYLSAIVEALGTDEQPSLWVYHTAVESDSHEGEFFITTDEVVYPDDGPDFEKLLS